MVNRVSKEGIINISKRRKENRNITGTWDLGEKGSGELRGEEHRKVIPSNPVRTIERPSIHIR